MIDEWVYEDGEIDKVLEPVVSAQKGTCEYYVLKKRFTTELYNYSDKLLNDWASRRRKKKIRKLADYLEAPDFQTKHRYIEGEISKDFDYFSKNYEFFDATSAQKM